MPKKQSPPRSLDGFVPPTKTTRSVGFDANRKAAARAAGAFPAIGQTLPAYTPPAQAPARRQPLRTRPSHSPFNLALDEPKAKPAARKHRKRRFWPARLGWKRTLALCFVLLLLVGGWVGYKFAYNASKTFNGSLFGLLSTTKLKGEDVGRVNILLAGNSSDDPGHNGGNLTDSIMVISLDTKNNTAFMMSVPRDLWVNIPGYGHAKINEAYVDGEEENFSQAGYFPGGMGLLQQVVQSNFGLTLNYYALINYEALKDMVNAVGGIDINVKSTDPRGLYDPSRDYATNQALVKLTNGPHTLNGEQALDLARARGDAYGSYGFPASDFDRTSNQRLELLALKSKVVSAGTLSNPVTVSKLSDSVGKNVKTNMSLSEARRAYDIGKKVGNIQSIGLNSVDGKDLLASYASPEGQSALIPAAGIDDFSDIQALLRQLTSTNPLARENAQVVVLNATNTSGLASAAAYSLKNRNINVVTTGNASNTEPKTTVIDASGGSKPATRTFLAKQFGNNVTATNAYATAYPDADFIVLIGLDRAPAAAAAGQ